MPAAEAAPEDDLRGDAFARLEGARSLLSTNRLTDAVAAAGALSGTEPVLAVHSFAPALEAVPAPAAGPVSELAAAVRQAEVLAGRAVRADPRVVDRAHLRLTAALSRGDEEGAAIRYQNRWASAVDRGALLGGASVLAAAIERTLPALSRSSTSGRSVSANDACDTFDSPVVCVGGSGPNIHTGDYPLLIDLGGDDTYTNSAGGADPLGNDLPVSVVLDLGGNDTYAATLPTASGARAAQGSGLVGGIGILVDQGNGNDTYSATAGAPGAGAWAQGFAAAGVGIQLDLGGNDSYRVSNRAPYAANPVSPLNFALYAGGKGVATFGGTGISIDSGGAETHVVEARPQAAVDDAGVIHAGDNVLAHGFGLGVFGGVGLFAEGQGTDTMTLEAASAPVAPGETRPFVPPVVNAFGFGTGGVGVGVAVTGPGISDRTIRAAAEAPDTGLVAGGGYGRGTIGGYGASHDAGGNDTYRAEILAKAVRHRTIDDSCSCSGVEVVTEAGTAFLDAAAGAGGLGGVGVLQDANGDDRYLMTASSVADAIARDERTIPVPPGPEDPHGSFAVAAAGIARVHALGFGINGGAGFLQDTGGNDAYDSRATSHGRAEASSTLSDAPVRAGPGFDQAISRAQGTGVAGHGELDDRQGADTYSSTSISTGEQLEGGIHGTYTGTEVSSVQGSVELGTALLSDVDNGAVDNFASSPTDAACSGTRGQVVWQDCGEGLGLGVNP